jgi:hypothetical protein
LEGGEPQDRTSIGGVADALRYNLTANMSGVVDNVLFDLIAA